MNSLYHFHNMRKTLSRILPILGFSLIPTLLVWAPFLLGADSFWNIPLPQDSMATIVSNYDGPLYIVVAKTLYNLEAISQNFSFDLPLEYYAAHFPLFPLLIRVFATITGLLGSLFSFAGYPYAMLLVTLLSSCLAIYFFSKFIRQYTSESNVVWLTAVFSLLPARWLIVRSVGSPEPLFIACIIASVYYFQNKRYWLAGLWGVAAQLTKSPGILLFVAYGLTLSAQSFKQIAIAKSKKLEHVVNWRAYPVLLIPISLLALFAVYRFTFNDFFAYFNSGDNIHLFFPPFQVFNYNAPWVGTFWLEEIIFIYFFGSLSLIRLVDIYKKAGPKDRERNAVVMWLFGTFFVSTLFVSHRDVMRYSLPLIPFLFAAWSRFLASRNFKIAFGVVVIPIYLYTLAFIAQNTMPISDWAPFL